MDPADMSLTVIRNLREDAIGRMHARRQVDEAQYSAARGYQRLFEIATLGNLSPADLLRPRVDGGRIPDPISTARMAAAKRLRSVEGTLKEQHGAVGLSLTRSVLTEGKSVEGTARGFGAKTTREVRFWGLLFRKCLDCLTKTLGLSNTVRHPRRIRPDGDGAPNLDDPRMHASAAELDNPALRRGRSNGRDT